MAPSPSAREICVVLWAVGGVVALCAVPLARLVPIALEPLRAPQDLGPLEIGCYGGWAIACGYMEGYRGFQKSFAPRVVARALHLARAGSALQVLLGPAYAMALVHATRRRLGGAWGLVLGITVLVVLVRMLPQPWRGIVDGGVVVGLSWGIGALVVFLVRALRGKPPTIELDLPR